MVWIGTPPVSLIVVPDWIVLLLAVCSLVTGGAAAGALILKGITRIREGWRALLKPWTEYPQQLKALQEHDAQEDLCRNHREPAAPKGD